jgi:hypothetical protein
MVQCCVSFAVRNEFLNIIYIGYGLKTGFACFFSTPEN